ncbi:hypothetical protein [Cryptosporangium sp. NPDC051539]
MRSFLVGVVTGGRSMTGLTAAALPAALAEDAVVVGLAALVRR